MVLAEISQNMNTGKSVSGQQPEDQPEMVRDLTILGRILDKANNSLAKTNIEFKTLEAVKTIKGTLDTGTETDLLSSEQVN